MNAIRLLPVILSALLLAAHFLRAGDQFYVVVCLAAPWLLLVRRPWVPRLAQAALAIGTGIWIVTAFRIVDVRISLEAPWTTAASIIGAVAAWTAVSALVFETRALRERYLYQRPKASEE